MKFDRKCLIFLILIIICGAALRLFQLGTEALWCDEAWTLHFIRNYPLLQIPYLDVHPPLFYWLEYGAFNLLPFHDEWVLRIFPALWGVLLIPLAFIISKEVIDDDLMGVCAAVFVAINPYLICQSQNARSYSLLLLVFSVLLILYIQALRSDDINKWLYCGILAGLCVWIHYFSIIPLALLLLYALYDHWRDPDRIIRGPATAILISVLISSPLGLLLCRLIMMPNMAGVNSFEGYHGLGFITGSLSGFYGVSQSQWITIVPLVILAIIGFIILYRRENRIVTPLGLLFLSFIPLILMDPYVALDTRYVVYLILPMSIFLAAMIFLVSIRPLQVVMVLILLIGIALPLIPYYADTTREPMDALQGDLDTTVGEGDTIAFIGPLWTYERFIWYYSGATVFRVGSYDELVQRPAEWVITAGDDTSSEDARKTQEWLSIHTENSTLLEPYNLNLYSVKDR